MPGSKQCAKLLHVTNELKEFYTHKIMVKVDRSKFAICVISEHVTMDIRNYVSQ